MLLNFIKVKQHFHDLENKTDPFSQNTIYIKLAMQSIFCHHYFSMLLNMVVAWSIVGQLQTYKSYSMSQEVNNYVFLTFLLYIQTITLSLFLFSVESIVPFVQSLL